MEMKTKMFFLPDLTLTLSSRRGKIFAACFGSHEKVRKSSDSIYLKMAE